MSRASPSMSCKQSQFTDRYRLSNPLVRCCSLSEIVQGGDANMQCGGCVAHLCCNWRSMHMWLANEYCRSLASALQSLMCVCHDGSASAALARGSPADRWPPWQITQIRNLVSVES
eukprot:6177335-Pleurochrysis_carterae.AAC.2